MDYADPRKQAALSTGLALVVTAVFGFMLLNFAVPAPEIAFAADGAPVQARP